MICFLQKALAGKLLILGGSAQSFAAVAAAYQAAQQAGAGECRVVLPDALKKAIDPQAFDCLFVPTNQSGGFSKEALPQLKAAIAWADALLLIGDAGRNSETAILYEQALAAFPDKLTLITRDALDLLKASWPQLLEHDRTVFIATLAQLQKIFQSVYYPKTILFSMQLVHLVEAMHKFTLTYSAALVVFHQNQLVIARSGKVVTTPWEDPLQIWRGSVAAKSSVYAMQNAATLLEGLATSLL